MDFFQGMGMGVGNLQILPGPPIITTSSLPDGEAGVAYSQAISKTGFPGGTWSVVSGSLPTGLSLKVDTGVVEGTPTVVNSFAFTVRYTDPYGQYDDQALALTVNSSYHPDDDLTAYELYAIAESPDVAESGGAVTSWDWRGTVAGQFKPGAAAPAATAGVPDFDGVDDQLVARNDADSANVNMSSFIGASAMTIFVVVDVDGIDGASGTPTANNFVFGQNSNGLGIHLYDSDAGAATNSQVWAWVYDGGYRSVLATLGFNQTGQAVLMFRRDATHIFVSVNGGAEVSTTAGATQFLAAVLQLGESDNFANELNGRLKLVAAADHDEGATNAAAIATRLKDYFGI